MEYLYNMLYRKIVTGCALSPSELRDVTMFLIYHYQLTDYVSGVLLSDLDQALAEYSIRKKRIVYDYVGIDNFIKNMFFGAKLQQHQISYNNFYLFYQLNIVLHEVRHVIQFKKMNSYVREKDDYVISSIIEDILKMGEDKYDDYYQICPTEKDASLFGFSKTFSLFRTLMNRNSDNRFLQMIKSQYNFQVFDGYRDPQNGTLKDFYHLALKRDYLYKRYASFASSLTTYDKLSFNFDLSDDDLNRIASFFQRGEVVDPIKVLNKKV